MDADRDQLNQLTERSISSVYKVANTLGSGFLEKVYENALAHELRKRELRAEQQAPAQVLYDGIVVGEYLTDIMVEDAVVLELKAVKALDDIHMAQYLNYLRATSRKICLLINLGLPKVEIRRIVNQF